MSIRKNSTQLLIIIDKCLSADQRWRCNLIFINTRLHTGLGTSLKSVWHKILRIYSTRYNLKGGCILTNGIQTRNGSQIEFLTSSGTLTSSVQCYINQTFLFWDFYIQICGNDKVDWAVEYLKLWNKLGTLARNKFSCRRKQCSPRQKRVFQVIDRDARCSGLSW